MGIWACKNKWVHLVGVFVRVVVLAQCEGEEAHVASHEIYDDVDDLETIHKVDWR